jgi:Rps23 Pro-64 3,4-dihydroxylase Tpa1-like proline 4-hydroxylase
MTTTALSTINPAVLDDANLEKLREAFLNAKPYPHIAIENFLSEETARTLYENFPKASEMRRNYQGLNENKAEGSAFEAYHPAFGAMQRDIMDPEFLKKLEYITGIPGLIIPADHRGSGVHQGYNGSFLDVHVDFSVHPTLKLHRRLNLLIYLNPNWKEEYGGGIELWNADMTKLEKCYMPFYNRCVIFECNEVSWHGYDKITLPETESRKSIFAYYYTDLTPGVRYHDTIFKARPTESSAKKIKTTIKENLKNTIKSVFYKLGLKNFFNKVE